MTEKLIIIHFIICAVAIYRLQNYNFFAQFPDIAISLKTIGGAIRDHYIVTDYGSADEKLYHCGASSKAGGRKVVTITEIYDRKNIIN